MWGVTVASIIGTVANIYKLQWCFVVWLATNSVWCVYDFYIGAYPQAALFAVYVLLAIWGILEWYGIVDSRVLTAKATGFINALFV